MIFLIVLILIGIVVFWVWQRTKIDVDRYDLHNLYFGRPGSGKSTFLAKIAYLSAKKNNDVYSNVAIDGCYMIDRRDIGHYDYGNALVLYDEASLDGFDNRDYKTNFRDEDKLEYLKKGRHYGTKFIWSNQGFDELDKKIRTLTTQLWLVTPLGPFSVARRVRKDVGSSKDGDDIVDRYKFPSVFSIIFNRHCIQLCYRKRYYHMFDSYDKRDLPGPVKVLWCDQEDK